MRVRGAWRPRRAFAAKHLPVQAAAFRGTSPPGSILQWTQRTGTAQHRPLLTTAGILPRSCPTSGKRRLWSSSDIGEVLCQGCGRGILPHHTHRKGRRTGARDHSRCIGVSHVWSQATAFPIHRPRTGNNCSGTVAFDYERCKIRKRLTGALDSREDLA